MRLQYKGKEIRMVMLWQAAEWDRMPSDEQVAAFKAAIECAYGAVDRRFGHKFVECPLLPEGWCAISDDLDALYCASDVIEHISDTTDPSSRMRSEEFN